MGLDTHDIEQVIHVGPSTDIEDYVQEIGRIGSNNDSVLSTDEYSAVAVSFL